MKSSPLLSKPEFVSQFNVIDHAEYEAAVSKRVVEYFLASWPWASDRQKEIYLQKDIETPMLLTCPRAPEDRAELMARYCLSLVAFDDFLEIVARDKAIKTVEGIKGVLLQGLLPQNAFEKLMYDFRGRMVALGNDRSHELANQLFVRTVAHWEMAITDTNRHKALGNGIDGYLEYRRIDGGVPVIFIMFAWELDLGAPPDHLLGDPDYNLLFTLAGDHVMLINDMFSYRHEMRLLEDKNRRLYFAGEKGEFEDGQEFYVCSSVRMLLREDGVDEFNVMDRLGTHIRRKESDFLAAVERIKVRYRDRAEDLAFIQTWVATLTDFMAGNYIWSSTCRRYNKLEIVTE